MDRFSSEINLVSQEEQKLCYTSNMPTTTSKGGSEGRRSGLARSFRFIIPHVMLVVVYLLYLALGGVVFSILEAPTYNELSTEEHAKMAEAQYTKEIIMEAFRNASSDDLKLDEGNITTLLDSLIDTVNHPDWKAGRQKTLMMGRDWSLPSAMLFSMTTITTIGYGDLVPETRVGQAVCVIYSAIGIPYSFFLLADIGQVLAFGFIRLIKWLSVCQVKKTKSKEKEADVYDDVQRPQLPRRRLKDGKTKKLRGSMPNVTMRHLQSVRFSVDPDETPSRRAQPKSNREINDKVIGMNVLGAAREESSSSSSPNTNNSGLDQSCQPSCNDGPNTSVTMVTTTFDEKMEPIQIKEDTTEIDKDSKIDEYDVIGDEDYSGHREYTGNEVSLTLVFFTLLSYVCISSFAFSLVEDWDYGTAFYFTFITLTTIGFGDIVPEEQYEPSRFFFCLLFTVLGLAVTSMCIALVQDRASRAGRRLLGYLDCRRKSTDVEEQAETFSTRRDSRCREV